MSNSDYIMAGAIVRNGKKEGEVVSLCWDGQGAWISWMLSNGVRSESFHEWDELDTFDVVGYWAGGKFYKAEEI